MPRIGFGTWEITPDDTARKVVREALNAGYRLIDTARIYGNERGVGAAVRESGVARGSIYVTTKLWNDDQGYDRTLRACDKSLEKLGLDYLDSYLIHWPATQKRYESWRAFETLIQNGRIKSAGVSNFTIRHLEELSLRSKLVPAVNQIEFHPFIYTEQKALLAYCKKENIIVEGYSPLNRISHERHVEILRISHAYNKTPQQIVLRWCFQHDVVPIVRSKNREHINSDIAIFNFTLSPDDMHRLDTLSDGVRVTWDPSNMS